MAAYSMLLEAKLKDVPAGSGTGREALAQYGLTMRGYLLY
jgi:hypothetical protein